MTAQPAQPQPAQPQPAQPQPQPDPRSFTAWPREPFNVQPSAAPLPAERQDQIEPASSQPSLNGVAFPGAAASAPSFADEISIAVSYERGLALKALVAVVMVILVLAVRQVLLF